MQKETAGVLMIMIAIIALMILLIVLPGYLW